MLFGNVCDVSRVALYLDRHLYYSDDARTTRGQGQRQNFANGSRHHDTFSHGRSSSVGTSEQGGKGSIARLL